jgi:hypothetical protein
VVLLKKPCLRALVHLSYIYYISYLSYCQEPMLPKINVAMLFFAVSTRALLRKKGVFRPISYGMTHLFDYADASPVVLPFINILNILAVVRPGRADRCA